MSNAISGLGTSFKRWNADTSTWITLAEINSMSGPNINRDTVEVTTLTATDGRKRYISGFWDAGSINFNMNFTRATYDLLYNDVTDTEVKDYLVELPDNSLMTFEFGGLVLELNIEISTDDKIVANCTIQIAGDFIMYSGSEESSGVPEESSGEPPETYTLQMTFRNITLNGWDIMTLNDWNTFFDLPTNGPPFISIYIHDDIIELVGETGVTLKALLFNSENDIVQIIDGGCVTHILSQCFTGANYFTLASFPSVVSVTDSFKLAEKLVSVYLAGASLTIGNNCFYGCYDIELIDIRNCIQLGSTTGDNGVFNFITNQTISLYIPAALTTDGDVAYLTDSAQGNTVTIIET